VATGTLCLATPVLLGACSFEVIVPPGSQADIDWNDMSTSEQAMFCDVYDKDKDLFREITFQSLQEERGWTNTDSMWQYWITITSNCDAALSPSDSPSRSTEASPSSSNATPAPSPNVTSRLGESGYPVEAEQAFVKAVRENKKLGPLAARADDRTLFVAAVPICVIVREEGASRSEMADVMESADIDPLYIDHLIELALRHLCPG
jgi:hypothetical protein